VISVAIGGGYYGVVVAAEYGGGFAGVDHEGCCFVEVLLEVLY